MDLAYLRLVAPQPPSRLTLAWRPSDVRAALIRITGPARHQVFQQRRAMFRGNTNSFQVRVYSISTRKAAHLQSGLAESNQTPRFQRGPAWPRAIRRSAPSPWSVRYRRNG